MWALAACAAISLAYVFPLLLVSPQLPRSHPVSIRQRSLCVLGTCSVSWLPTAVLAKVPPGLSCAGIFSEWRLTESAVMQGSPALAARALGLTCSRPAACTGLPVLLVYLLFLGPVVMAALDMQQELQMLSGRGSLQCGRCVAVLGGQHTSLDQCRWPAEQTGSCPAALAAAAVSTAGRCSSSQGLSRGASGRRVGVQSLHAPTIAC